VGSRVTYVCEDIEVGGERRGDDGELCDSGAGDGSKESQVLELHLDGIVKSRRK
jgi:hypothetical protein